MCRFVLACAVALAAFLPAFPALAQSPLTPVSISVTRFDTLPRLEPDYGMACCALPVAESGPDSDFYYVDMDFNVAWSDELDRISYSSRDILLYFEGGDEEGLRPFARINYLPIVEMSGGSISARRPRDWPDETAQAFLNQLWQVPAGVTQANLVIGEEGDQIEITLNFDIPVSETMRPLETVDIALNGLTISDGLSGEDSVSFADFTTTTTPTIGELLQLDVTITPLMNTQTDSDVGENRFFFYNNYVSLIGPEGVPLAIHGQGVSDGVRNDYSNSMSWDDDANGSDRSFYFIGAGTPGTYQVYYLSDLVGEIALQ